MPSLSNYSEINWQEIYVKINEAIAKLENFKKPGQSYHLSPDAVSEIIDDLLEIRLLIPAGNFRESDRESAD